MVSLFFHNDSNYEEAVKQLLVWQSQAVLEKPFQILTQVKQLKTDLSRPNSAVNFSTDLHAGFAIGGASGRESDSEWSPVIETLLTISKNAAGVLFTFLERL